MPNLLTRMLDFLRLLLPPPFGGEIPLVPVVRLSGAIGVVTPLKPGLMLASVARTLERAFSIRGAKAVALIVNSPGGSPAQSHLIFRRIRQLAEEKKLPVLLVELVERRAVNEHSRFAELGGDRLQAGIDDGAV